MLVPRRMAGWVVAAACGAAMTAAAATPRHATNVLSLDASAGAVYDDNVLQYSDSLLSAFVVGNRRDLFAVRSTDDLVWKPSLALTWTHARRNGVGRAIRLSASGRYHAADGIADVTGWSARWRETFSPSQRLSVGYFAMPHYYLRQLFDEDAIVPYHRLSRYRPAHFDLSMVNAAWHTRVARRMTIESEYRREHRAYVPAFRERTSTLQGVSATATATGLPRHGTLELSAGYAWNQARATDGDDSLGLIADDADVSFHGPLAHMMVRADLARISGWRVSTDASAEVENRIFTSTRTADTWHNGRRDVALAEEFGLRVDPPGAWSLRAFYRHEKNVARLGYAAPATADAGDYTQQQVGALVTFSADLWKSGDPMPRVPRSPAEDGK